MKQFCLLFLFGLMNLSLQAQPSHEAFDILLKKHVSSDGKVNYKNFKTDKTALENYIKTLIANVPQENWSKNDKMTYWINAYNALTINLIIQNYPLSKITDLDGGKTWDVKRYTFGNKKLSLNDIENTILRPMSDARIHFAINCAAKSCPPLHNQAFTINNLNNLLDSRTKSFINSEANTLKTNEIKVSKIFDWYGKDFGDLITYFNKYSKVKIGKTAKISFQEYDWRLNE
ncbi:MAG: DUF547 domain-containing protein [Saprospiraceae bacterium]|nr:DUF547 domain-containing protein [Saprospiraceae bacterium]